MYDQHTETATNKIKQKIEKRKQKRENRKQKQGFIRERQNTSLKIYKLRQ